MHDGFKKSAGEGQHYQRGQCPCGRAVASRMWCSLKLKFLVQKREAWLEAKDWVSTPAMPLTCWVILDKSRSLSEPHFPI